MPIFKKLTKEEIQAIIRLTRAGKSNKAVGEAIGATEEQVKNAIRMIRKHRPDALPPVRMTSRDIKVLIDEAIRDL